MRHALILLALWSVAACQEKPRDSTRLINAVEDAVCATDRDELEIALGTIADEARVEGDEVEDIVQQAAAQADCR